ncbi:MAG TPA: hypothetical protein VJ123_08970 [Anaerolineales bacterium]|nr:hypothetical protein [Anaerolineales bacterium]
MRLALFVTPLLLLASCQDVGRSDQIHRAGLLVRHSDGRIASVCVEFAEDEITGEELLARSGLAHALDASNPMGALVCSVDGEGCGFPSEACFCRCEALGECDYWAYFTRLAQGGWTYSPNGLRARKVRQGDLDAWVWLSAAGAPEQTLLPDLQFVDVCPSS